MGCLCGKGTRVTDSNQRGSGSDVQVLNEPEQLTQFFPDFGDPKPKCAFVFGELKALNSYSSVMVQYADSGGSGSNKGEFMWDLVQRHSESGTSDLSITYIDMDRLIAVHIKQRIMDLVREGNHFAGDAAADDEDVTGATLSPDATSETESVESDFRPESVKSFLLEFASVVTSTWVFRLLDEEMRRLSGSFPDKRFIFLVNLIPNRVNLFKRCLFLNQSPHLYQIPFEFIALNLIRGNCQWKDLDLVAESSFSDEVNGMFVKYFRSIDKLVDIVPRLESYEKKLKVKVSNNQPDASYKRVSCRADINQLLRRHEFTRTLCINISDLPASEAHQTSTIIFILDNKIDVDAKMFLEVDESVRDAAQIKTLIDYLRTSRKVMEAERKDQLSPGQSSTPKSRLSLLSSSDK